MKKLFQDGSIRRVDYQKHYIVFDGTIFIAREIETNFLVYESSADAKYETVRDFVFAIERQ